MIDIHSHLLFGVDDGCHIIEDSLALVEKAIESGITGMILTPHYSFRRGFCIPYDAIEARFNFFVDIVKEKGLKIDLYLGSEIDETNEIFEFLETNMCHTMYKSNYVLIDFGTRKADIDDICYALILRGYKPIVAHPERYIYIGGIDKIKEWRKTGALIQINGSSLFGSSKEKKLVKELIKNNMVDFIASDIHHSNHSYNHFLATVAYATKKLGKEIVENIVKVNPRKIINWKVTT